MRSKTATNRPYGDPRGRASCLVSPRETGRAGPWDGRTAADRSASLALEAVLWFDPALSVSARAAVSSALECAGVVPSADARAPFAVAILDRIADAAIADVRRLAAPRPERVIAIAATTQALDDVTAWDLLAAGAADAMAWDPCGSTAGAVGARLRRWSDIDALLADRRVAGTLVGDGTAMRAALRDVVEVARFSNSNLLLTGETGTGKELVARL